MIHLHYAESVSLLAPDRQRGDGELGSCRNMCIDQFAKIHAVQLVAAEDQHVLEIIVQQMHEVLAHRIRRAFVPGRGAGGLAGGRCCSTKPPAK